MSTVPYFSTFQIKIELALGPTCQKGGRFSITFLPSCYRLNVWVYQLYTPFPTHILKPNAPCVGVRSGAFGRCLGHKGGALVNGLQAFIKERVQRAPSPFPPREDTVKTLNQEECPHQTLNMLTTSPWTPQTPEL